MTSTDLLYLHVQVAQMPRSRDLAIFVLMTDKLIALPLAAHARAG